MNGRIVVAGVVGLLFALTAFGSAAAASSVEESADRAALSRAVPAMCHRSVVLLGEASHGDGHTDAVKVEIVKRLVKQCRFNVVLFEASAYEFMPVETLRRAKSPVPPKLIADAVGGLWKFDREVQPLFPFLADEIGAGKVRVGGLDFQLGGLEQPFGNGQMFDNLSRRLPNPRRSICRALFRAHVVGGDVPDGMNAAAVRELLEKCVGEIGADIAQQSLTASDFDRDEQFEVRNLSAWLLATRGEQRDLIRARDAMMADNVIRHIEAAGRGAKVVIWTHNAHAATSSIGQAGVTTDTLGSLLRSRFGMQVYALAVTARDGSFRWSRNMNRPLERMPIDSIEAVSSGKSPSKSTFVSHRALRRMGNRPAAVFHHSYRSAVWSDAFDGMLVLNAEHPPDSAR